MPGDLNGVPDANGETGPQFGYAFLSPAQPTFYQPGLNCDTDLGLLNPNTPVVTYSTSADIRRFVDYGHGLSDSAENVLHMITYYEDMAQRFGGLGPAQ